MARGSLLSFEFNFSRTRLGFVFSWVCTNNTCLVHLHLSCDFSASVFFYPLFTAVVSRERFVLVLSNECVLKCCEVQYLKQNILE